MIEISNKKTNILAAILLSLMFLLAVFSVKDDSPTSDEIAYITAGYSYLTQKSYHLNPEHPPLIKDLSAIPLLFLNLNFPKEHSYGVWILGSEFLYHSGNNPDQILFWARLPMIFILLFLGWFLFKWTRELAGNFPALLVLFLFSFSPDFLAHGRLVTFDVGATLGFVLATHFYLKFLKEPTKKHVVLSGLTLGFALLVKISTISLIPFFGIISLIFFWLKSKGRAEILSYIKSIILIGLVAILVIWLVYQFHLLNYSKEAQLNDTKESLAYSQPSQTLKNFCLWSADKSILRPFGHYLTGSLFSMKRALEGGVLVYLLGQISYSSWWYYFPVAYLLKVPLAFHILTLIVLLLGVAKLVRIKIQGEIKKWINNHFTEFSMLVFLIFFWFISTTQTHLNIGIRHILPIFPFTYVLVSLGIKNWVEEGMKRPNQKIVMALILILLFWYAISSLSVFPHYLTYFNELAGGSKNGYKYLVDSNYDWGQDLKRLAEWVDSQGIKKIYIDYFGGGDVKYYLGEKAIPWYGSSWWGYLNIPKPEEVPNKNYFAVSATLLQWGRGKPVKGFYGYSGEYNWLNRYQPIAQIGNSIFVYYIY
jgi:hypothetical protein